MAHIIEKTTTCKSCKDDFSHGVYYILRDSKRKLCRFFR